MSEIGRGRGESFSRYYLRQIALGEGCNCAEALLAPPKPTLAGGLDRPAKPSMVARIRSLFRRKPASP